MLARGWLAKDEPAVFMVGADLVPHWHYRTALQPENVDGLMTSAAKDPASGMPVWVSAADRQTIHLLRADGLTDHFRLQQPFVGLALTPRGNQLILNVVYRDQTEMLELRWK
jgi:hypothetical protein